MKVIAHRGAPFEALENSFSAFARAVDAGCQMIEFDVWGAEDGSLWVCHDDSLLRTTGLDTEISSSCYEKLEKVKLSNGEPLPSLENCFKKFLPSVELNVELKDTSSRTVDSLLEFLKAYPLERLVVSCFDLKPLELIEKKNSNVQLALLSASHNTYAVDPLDYLKEHPQWFFHPQADILTCEQMDLLSERGTKVYPWVPLDGIEKRNQESFWSVMKAFQVDGLCTNYPREFRAWLNHEKKT